MSTRQMIGVFCILVVTFLLGACWARLYWENPR